MLVKELREDNYNDHLAYIIIYSYIYMSKQPAKQPAKKDDTLKPGQYLEADNVIIRYMGPKVDGKYAVRVEDKFGRKKPTGIKTETPAGRGTFLLVSHVYRTCK